MAAGRPLLGCRGWGGRLLRGGLSESCSLQEDQADRSQAGEPSGLGAQVCCSPVAPVEVVVLFCCHDGSSSRGPSSPMPLPALGGES